MNHRVKLGLFLILITLITVLAVGSSTETTVTQASNEVGEITKSMQNIQSSLDRLVLLEQEQLFWLGVTVQDKLEDKFSSIESQLQEIDRREMLLEAYLEEEDLSFDDLKAADQLEFNRLRDERNRLEIDRTRLSIQLDKIKRMIQQAEEVEP